MFVGQAVPWALDLDEAHPFGGGVPHGEVGKTRPCVPVVLDQPLANTVQLARCETRHQAEKVVRAPRYRLILFGATMNCFDPLILQTVETRAHHMRIPDALLLH